MYINETIIDEAVDISTDYLEDNLPIIKSLVFKNFSGKEMNFDQRNNYFNFLDKLKVSMSNRGYEYLEQKLDEELLEPYKKEFDEKMDLYFSIAKRNVETDFLPRN